MKIYIKSIVVIALIIIATCVYYNYKEMNNLYGEAYKMKEEIAILRTVIMRQSYTENYKVFY